MRCPEIDELELHLAGELRGESRRSVSDHVGSCPACAIRLREVSDNLASLPVIREALRGAPAPAGVEPPRRIGSFAIVREIARGGMGVIYLAEQERPRREVALKVLRPGVGSADTLRRFEREAEYLARLRHPGIATVYEAGVTTLVSGGATERVPYIAMEYVRGERLDRYAAAGHLSLERKLELVAGIADAVHHAHVNGLVHRDLKPGNILVVPADGDGPGEPKVLDFGIARLAEGKGDGTLRTSTGQVLGTLPYMSPEQLAGDPEAVDARSDVYSLGVIACELLTGELPYDVGRLSLAEAARVIREATPGAPGRRDTKLRGDVDTIVLKMLEKEPDRRYATAAEAADDIRRFLAREPIRARPPGSWYQLTRFAQRNRSLAATLAALLLVLIAAAAVSGALAVRARRAEHRAQQQLQEARRQADRFEAVNRFLEEMMAAPSPEDHPGATEVTVRESIGQGIARLDAGSLEAQPEIELGVRTAIGNTYRALGEYDAARRQLERAVELGRRLHPDGHPDLADALNKLGRVLQETGEYDSAEAVYRECLDMRRRIPGEASEDIANTLNNLAYVVSRRGRTGEALALHQEALAMRRALFGPAHGDIASSLNNIASIRYALGELETAEALLRESLQMDRDLRGDLHANVAMTMNNLALVLSDLGRFDEAEPMQRRALELEREIYEAGHPRQATSLLNLARMLVAMGRLDEAEQPFAEALDVARRGLGDRHPDVANILGNYAALYEGRRDFERAEAMHREALAIRRETLGDRAVKTLGSRYNLARVAEERGDHARAADAYASVVADARAILPADSPQLFTVLAGYGLCLYEMGRQDEAIGVLREARDVGSSNIGKGDPRLAEVAEALARLEGGT